MHWKIKAAAFRALDVMPWGTDAHFFLQRNVTRNWPRKTVDVEALAVAAKRALAVFRASSSTAPENATFLEVGAGRDLTVPLGLAGLGVKRVVTIDIARLAKLDLVNHAARTLSQILDCEIPIFRSWDDLRAYGVDYRAPTSVHDLIGDVEVDVFTSNEVLEHVPPDALRQMLGDAHQVMTPGALAIHAIDYSDHYARGGAVSRYNFLSFSDEAWRPYNSGFQYVNRLRHSEYQKMFEAAGLSVVATEPYRETIDPSIMKGLADRFKKFDPDDLAVMRSLIVARKSEASG